MENIDDVREAENVEEAGLDTENGGNADELFGDPNETDDSEGINDSESEDNDDEEYGYNEEYIKTERDKVTAVYNDARKAFDNAKEAYDKADKALDDAKSAYGKAIKTRNEALKALDEAHDKVQQIQEYDSVLDIKFYAIEEKLLSNRDDSKISSELASKEEILDSVDKMAVKLAGECGEPDEIKERLQDIISEGNISVEALHEITGLTEKLSTCDQDIEYDIEDVLMEGLSEVYGIKVASVSCPSRVSPYFELTEGISVSIAGFTKENVCLPSDPFHVDLKFDTNALLDRSEVLMQPSEGLVNPAKVSLDIGGVADALDTKDFVKLCATVGEVRNGDTIIQTDELFSECESSLDKYGNYSDEGYVSIDENGRAHIVKGERPEQDLECDEATSEPKANEGKSAFMSAGCPPQESSQQKETEAESASKASEAGKGRSK